MASCTEQTAQLSLHCWIALLGGRPCPHSASRRCYPSGVVSSCRGAPARPTTCKQANAEGGCVIIADKGCSLAEQQRACMQACMLNACKLVCPNRSRVHHQAPALAGAGCLRAVCRRSRLHKLVTPAAVTQGSEGRVEHMVGQASGRGNRVPHTPQPLQAACLC